MANISKISKITRLAKRFGNPLIDAELINNGIIFRYRVGNTVSEYRYSDTDRGIEEEIERLEKLLAVEL